MKPLILVLCIALMGNAHADDMSTADYARQGVIAGLLLIDYGQSIYIHDHPLKHREHNSIILRHNTPEGIRNYFLAATVISAGITKALPKEYRPAFQYTLIAVETWQTIHNKRRGVGVTLDGWSGRDKAQHIQVSAVAGAIGSAMFREDKAWSWSAFAVGMAPGVAKELYDSRKGGSGWSNKDLAADALGAAFGVTVGQQVVMRVSRRNGVTHITIAGTF